MIITFDCYGTLIDWESGIFDAFRAASSVAPKRERLLAIYHEEEAKIEREEWRPYREVLAETARKAGERLDLSVGDGSFLPDSLAQWRPFSDVNPALRALKQKGVGLAVLSNIDDELFATSARHFDIELDFVVTAEAVRSYKPAPAHFLEAQRRIGNAPWIHAAQSWYHDVVPARSLGVRTFWINRTGEKRGPESVEPEVELPGLTPLVALID